MLSHFDRIPECDGQTDRFAISIRMSVATSVAMTRQCHSVEKFERLLKTFLFSARGQGKL